MACSEYSKRKLYRMFTVKSALLGVPVVWLLFILWTIYYTQYVEKTQSMRQLALTSEPHDYVAAYPYKRDSVDLDKAVKARAKDAQNKKRKLKINDNSLRFQTKVEILRRAKTQSLSANDRRQNSQPDYGKDYDNAEGDQNVYNGQEVYQTATKVAVKINRSSRERLSRTSNQSHPETPQYLEFVWKGDKPTRKIITAGKRFDPPKLGEFGKAVIIDPQNLSKRQREQYEEGWQNHKFNEYASLQISTQRQTPDYRPPECKEKNVQPNLQKATIIICFYNEAWSVLIRTINSVLTRSPAELVAEIILVDDFSNLEMMGEPLEYYVTQVDKLRLLRMTKRSGLVRARLAGVKEAKGPILVFLDSHVECAEGWLQPLLQTIQENPKYAVTPEIDVINHKDFSINAAVDNIGVFSFHDLQFDWSNIMPRIRNSITSMAESFKSPSMAGGLFAISKDYFVSIGTYDPGLEVWGGENIELSLKLWMCGGGILIHPCSRVSHIFRNESPYLLKQTLKVLSKNSARVAQVWLDEYRDLYFNGVPYDEKKYGSVQERIEVRKRLQCRSFTWYLDNIYPEMYIKGAGRFLGKIKSATGLCINQDDTSPGSQLYLEDCDNASVFESSRMKEIRSPSKCMDIRGTSHLILRKCDLEDRSQTFEYSEGVLIRHVLSKSCLTASSHGPELRLKPCSGERLQTWQWPKNPHFIPSS